jgi:sortase A
MSRTTRALRLAAAVFLAGGLLALGYAAYVITEANTYQTIELRRFERERQAPAVEPALASEPPLVEGGPIGEIRIPRLHLAAVVAEGDSPAVLRVAVGHLAETALPGQPGNVVLAGHRDTFFRPLKGVQVGDLITLDTRGGAFTYRVASTAVVPPSDLQVLRPTARHTLTLITCFPFAYIGSAPNRFIVRAHETDKAR